ncbi:hypothetical protein D3C71_535940 [compost metagenome]
MHLRRLSISLEDDANGEVQQEIEYTFFGRVDNFDWQSQASAKEKQEQWESYRDKGEGRFAQCRVRAIDDKTYHACVKAKRPGELGKAEVEQVCTKDYFEIFKEYADKGLNKVRYIFPIEGTDLKWEVDCYTTQDGQQHPWIKLDLEVKGVLEEIPKFPMELVESILNQPAKRTEEEQAAIGKLFEAWTIKFEPAAPAAE